MINPYAWRTSQSENNIAFIKRKQYNMFLNMGQERALTCVTFASESQNVKNLRQIKTWSNSLLLPSLNEQF
jgi:hypothetical protein